MDGILFLFLAFLVAFTSIKLSNYADALNKQTKLGSVLIGGILIAAITSLPEFITCISSVLINNPSLSFGDILGSNMFNIFVLAVYNIYFFKKNIFESISKEYIFESIILILEYLFIILGTSHKFMSLVTIFLFIIYAFYTFVILFFKNGNSEKEQSTKKVNYVILKFVTSSIILIMLSILLTLQVDKITHVYPNFSSTSAGAILLGITTSLPEVVTTFELFKLNNSNMAISNMLGSNIFNFLVLGLADIFVKNGHVYDYSDNYSLMYVYGGVFITFLLLCIILNKNKSKFYYLLISILMSISYFLVWYFQFN